MALPLRVKNALRLGNPQAASLPSLLPEGAAWVYIKPIMRGGQTFEEARQQWTRTRNTNLLYDDTIASYEVRLLDLSSWNPDTDVNYETDRTVKARAIRDEISRCADEGELENWLNSHRANANELRSPIAAGYWFG